MTALRAQRVAVAAVFFLNGAAFASWAVRLPALQERHALGEGALGLALLGAAAGLFVGLLAASALTARHGSRRVTSVAAVAYLAAVPLLALAPGRATLAAALVAVGFANGSLDLSMNAQAVVVERRYGRSIMSSFHGFFSGGGIAGAAAGGLAAAGGVALLPHLLTTAVVLGAVLAAAMRALPAESAQARAREAGKPVLVLPRGPLLALGAVAFCVLMAEGAINDWSAVYLRSVLDAGPGTAALGFALFAAAMTAGRLSGDRLVTWLGPTRVVRLGGALASLGLLATVLAPGPGLALAGFGLVGLGLAAIFPVVLAAAGRTPGVRSASALAAASTAGYLGFLTGPPLIGLLAELTGLRGGLGVVVACTALPLLLAGRVEPRSRVAEHRTECRPQELRAAA
ncbi:MAG TPA: MFS transporter [Thermoleophilaceae bacterium]|nr:MFS transporter [Thermoleophilaceae bacterium]